MHIQQLLMLGRYSHLAAERLLFDPNYEQSWKAIARLHAEEGRDAWWERGEIAPSRAPDWNNVVEAED